MKSAKRIASFMLDLVWQRAFARMFIQDHQSWTRRRCLLWVSCGPVNESPDLDISIQINWTRCEIVLW